MTPYIVGDFNVRCLATDALHNITTKPTTLILKQDGHMGP
jgi:hypothetical protein